MARHHAETVTEAVRPASGDAVSWVRHLREVRGDVTRGLADGGVSLSEVIARRAEPGVGSIHLRSILEAVPGTRRIDVRRWMSTEDLGQRTAMRDLDEQALSRIVEAFEPRAAP